MNNGEEMGPLLHCVIKTMCAAFLLFRIQISRLNLLILFYFFMFISLFQDYIVVIIDQQDYL